MPGPILNTLELKRLPFARRPIAQPGTVLVFQMPNNELIAPEPPYTTGETWWKGPKMAYVVDNRPHHGVFVCKLPAAGDAHFFDATVHFTWRVHQPVDVVREQVEDPEAECETYLAANLPTITRQHDYHVPAAAEEAVAHRVGRKVLPLHGRGICIEAVHAQLRIPPDQLVTFQQIQAAPHEQELARMKARYEAEIQKIKQQQMDDIVNGGPERLYAFIIQQDPARGLEVVTQMQAMADRDKQRAIEAIKVLIDGEEIRVGELDGAVAAAVDGFRNILGQYAGAGEPAKSLPEGDPAETEPS
ncbi:hypothetical protein [Paractinoplanes rishiriensis]|uniref:Band 7 domain-containing protein n=1 Tax=Paractinoplanes rishiriensis TaxID=1050105 RepID=A0A919MTT8_9ACTN|nr:hypothetical protein [Actinoplanes rishiriensis]GIE94629.1 hypothetical protein Ari01nite_20940 [Actinoplanes rishiriensis]